MRLRKFEMYHHPITYAPFPYVCPSAHIYKKERRKRDNHMKMLKLYSEINLWIQCNVFIHRLRQ